MNAFLNLKKAYREQELKDKNAVLSDVSEELRLLKIREKNLTEVCQKYMKENEELKKELADKVVDKIDAQIDQKRGDSDHQHDEHRQHHNDGGVAVFGIFGHFGSSLLIRMRPAGSGRYGWFSRPVRTAGAPGG